MNPFNRTFTQTFPCGTSLYPCYSRYGFVTPVRFDNFVRNTDIPFYINKYKSIYDIKQYCHKEPEPVNYIEEIQQSNEEIQEENPIIEEDQEETIEEDNTNDLSHGL